MAKSVIDTCSPVERRRSSSRAGGFVLSAFASPTSSSVVFPIAETTATTSSPAFFLAMSLFATILIRSGDATDVPPNLHTTNDISTLSFERETFAPLYQTARDTLPSRTRASDFPCRVHQAARRGGSMRSRSERRPSCARSTGGLHAARRPRPTSGASAATLLPPCPRASSKAARNRR